MMRYKIAENYEGRVYFARAVHVVEGKGEDRYQGQWGSRGPTESDEEIVWRNQGTLKVSYDGALESGKRMARYIAGKM